MTPKLEYWQCDVMYSYDNETDLLTFKFKNDEEPIFFADFSEFYGTSGYHIIHDMF